MSVMPEREWFADKSEADAVMLKVAAALKARGLTNKYRVKVVPFKRGYQVVVVQHSE